MDKNLVKSLRKIKSKKKFTLANVMKSTTNNKKYKAMMKEYDGFKDLEEIDRKFDMLFYEFSRVFHLCVKIHII